MVSDHLNDNLFPDDQDDEDLEEQEHELEEDADIQRRLEKRYEYLAAIKQQEADDARTQSDLHAAIAFEKEALELLDKASHCAELAAEDIRKEHELQRQEHVRQLAVMVRDPSKTNIVSLESAVSGLTGALQDATYQELARAADGSVSRGRKLRERVTALGVEIKHSLAQLSQLSKEDIVHFVQQVVEFTAAVMGIADHIVWFANLFRQFRPILEPFIFA